MDNIPSKLLKNRGETTITVPTAICQEVWETKEWPMRWKQSFVIPLPKTGNLKQCQNYRTISLISHPGKIKLQVILNQLKAKVEELLVEEQAGIRPGQSTAQQIFNSRFIIEKQLPYQRNQLFRTLQASRMRLAESGFRPVQVLRSFNTEEGLGPAIQAL